MSGPCSLNAKKSNNEEQKGDFHNTCVMCTYIPAAPTEGNSLWNRDCKCAPFAAESRRPLSNSNWPLIGVKIKLRGA